MSRPTVRCDACSHPWDDHYDDGCDTWVGTGNRYCSCERTPAERIAQLEDEIARIRDDCGHSTATRYRAGNGDLRCFCGVLVERGHAEDQLRLDQAVVGG